jgi:hypothetical protein
MFQPPGQKQNEFFDPGLIHVHVEGRGNERGSQGQGTDQANYPELLDEEEGTSGDEYAVVNKKKTTPLSGDEYAVVNKKKTTPLSGDQYPVVNKKNTPLSDDEYAVVNKKKTTPLSGDEYAVVNKKKTTPLSGDQYPVVNKKNTPLSDDEYAVVNKKKTTPLSAQPTMSSSYTLEDDYLEPQSLNQGQGLTKTKVTLGQCCTNDLPSL